jgi:PAS domain S-box-containing protein
MHLRRISRSSDRFLLVFLLYISVWLSHPVLSSDGDLPQLTKTSAVKQLSLSAAKLGYPVRLQGHVTYYDTDWRILYIQDAHDGINVELAQQNNAIKNGQWVEVEGISAPGNFLPIVSKARVKILGQKPHPSARLISLTQLDAHKADGQYIQLKCIVHNAYREAQHTVLEAYDGKEKIRIRIRGFSQAAANNLIDAHIQTEGVLGVIADSARQPIGLDLWVPNENPISVIEKPLTASNQIPVTSISTLLSNWKKSLHQHRIRIQGAVMPGKKENTLLVQDKTGIISAQTLFSRPITPGDEVDLIGFADLNSQEPRIIDAIYLRIKALAFESKEEKGLPYLTSIKDIRALSSHEAGRGYPIRINGVITYFDPMLSMIFIQDGTAAIYIQSFDPALILQQGHEYAVEGFSAPGDFAPIITKPKFRLIRKAQLPAARDISLDQLATGDYDCLRVQVQGTVRAVQQVTNRWRLDLFNSGKRIQVYLPNLPNSTHIQSLQDAQIRAQGICGIQISPWGNISGFRINVPSIEGIKIEKPARSDPFSVPLRPIRDIFRFANQAEMGRRIRVEGTLLHQQPGKALYIKDATGSMSIPTKDMLPVSASDVLAISGYPLAGEFAPTLEDVMIKRLRTGPSPKPRILPDASAFSNNFQGDLIRIKAKLIDQWRTSEGQGFILQDSTHTPFDAFLEHNPNNIAAPVLRNGSELDLTGIYLLHSTDAQKYGFHLLLRTADDVRLIKAAPWWTTQQIFWAFGILLFLILAASIWVSMLKIRVNRQTQIIQSRLESEAALEKKYQELFEKSNDIVFAFDHNAKLMSVNPSGEIILGYSLKELNDIDLTGLVDPASLAKVHEWIKMKLNGNECPVLECELLAKDGRHVILEVSGELLIADGQTCGIQGIARDITERKLAEEALRRSEEKLRQGQKLESIGRLAGGIAHDFNNILSAILGYSELSSLDLDADHPVQTNIKEITRAGKRARELVQQILAFGRKLEQERSPIYLRTIVEEAIKLLRPTLPTTISIEQSLPAETNAVLADPTQIHQVILNLATNAGQAMSSNGGTLYIGLEPVDLDEQNPYGPQGLPSGKFLCLSISDTGTGMAPEIQKKIFEPYFTTKSVGEGSGLGLAVVHGIVQNHGGAITVESKVGEGTCFRVYLPCCTKKPANQKSLAQEAAKGHGQILFVDDEEPIVNLGRRSLKKLGYSVVGETCSAKALKRFQADPMKFDLVLTDQTMPQLTGIALAQEMWKIRPTLPIIICTGFSEQITSEKIISMGFRALLNKPYTFAELTQTIQRCLWSVVSEDS